MAFFYSPSEHPMSDYSHGKNQTGSKNPPDRLVIFSCAEYVFKIILIPHHVSNAIFYRGKRTNLSRVFYKFLMFLPVPPEYPTKSMDFSFAYPSGYLYGRRNRWQLHSLWRDAGEKLHHTALRGFWFHPRPRLLGLPPHFRLLLIRLTGLQGISGFRLWAACPYGGERVPSYFLIQRKDEQTGFLSCHYIKNNYQKRPCSASVRNLSYPVN